MEENVLFWINLTIIFDINLGINYQFLLMWIWELLWGLRWVIDANLGDTCDAIKVLVRLRFCPQIVKYYPHVYG